MGVDISHIIRHDFNEVEDNKKAWAFVRDTVALLKKQLFINVSDDYFDIQHRSDEDDYEIEFRLPVYDVDFNLHNGFWQIESYFHYCQLIMHHNGHFGLRRRTYDIARALGQNEAWYAEEYFTWNGDGCEYAVTTFDQWMNSVHLNYGKNIQEFDPAAIMAHEDYNWKFEPIYHDSFKECNELFDSLQKKLKGYRLLGLHTFGVGYLRCEKDGGLFLINEDTLEPLFKEPIDGILYSLNGPEFVVMKGDLRAVFDAYGKQLTDYVKGDFYWRWATAKARPWIEMNKVEIYNDVAGIAFVPEYKS